MRVRHLSARVTVLAAAISQAAWAQPAHDLRVGAEAGVQVLVELTEAVEGEATTHVDGVKVSSAPRKIVGSRVFVDEYTSITRAGTRMTRYVAEWRTERDGEVRDPEVTGVTFELAEEGQTKVATRGGRLAGLVALNQMAQSANCAGLWLPLPKDAVVGDVFAIGLESLVAMMLGLPARPKSHRAELLFRSIDEEADVATMVGPLNVEAWVEEGGARHHHVYTGELTILIDTAARRVSEVDWRGRLATRGDSADGVVEVDAEFHYTVEATVGEPAAEALARPPEYRDTVREVPDLALRFALPSHWMPVDAESNTAEFKSTVDGDRDQGRTLEVAVFSTDDPASFTANVEAGVTKQSPDAKFRDVTTGLGGGRGVRFESDGRAVALDLIPDEDRMIRLRMESEPSHADAAAADLAVVRATLIRRGESE